MGANVSMREFQTQTRETRRGKMSWPIMSPAKLSNCDEDSNDNVVGLIRAGSGPRCLGCVSVSLCEAITNRMTAASRWTHVHKYHKQETCTWTHSCHFSPVKPQDVFAKPVQDISHLQRGVFCAEDTVTVHRSCHEHTTLPMCWTFWTDALVLVHLRKWQLKPESYRTTTTFWISLSIRRVHYAQIQDWNVSKTKGDKQQCRS